MNKVILIGRLTADPELKETTGGTPVTRFTVAVDRRFSKDGGADFITCIAWDKRATFICDWFRKGKQIALDGRIETRSWEGRDGKRQYATEVVVDNAEFCGPKESSSGGYPYKDTGKPITVADGFTDIEEASEEDLPF